MLVSDVARRVRGYAGDDVSQALVKDSFVIDGVNDAQLEFNAITQVITENFPLPTVADNNPYNLSSDWLSIISIHKENGRSGFLTPISGNQAIQSFGTSLTDSRGEPFYFTAENYEISLYPTPDAVYHLVVKLLSVPTIVTTITDPLSLPAYMQPSVARWIFALVKERDEDFEAAMAIKMEVRTKLGELMELARVAQEQSYPYIVDTEGGTQSYPVGNW